MRRFTAASALAALVALPLAALAQEAGPSQPPPAGATGSSPYARLLLLPDLSAIGSFAAAWNDYDVEVLSPRSGPYAPHESEPSFLFEELELGLQAVVDPYARADVFTSFKPDGVDVEEAYLTTLSLPYGLQAKAGKFFTPFGRENVLHPHARDFADASLVVDRLLAPEALSGPGASVAWLAPLPWFTELTVAAQSTVIGAGDRDHITGTGRLAQYFPLGDATTLGVGLSGAVRAEGAGEHRDLLGADVYVRIRPPAARSWVALTAEAFARRLGQPLSDADWGGYAQAVWRQGPHWAWGARWDTAPTAEASTAPPGREHRLSALASWLPSEFQRLRLQVGWDRLPGDKGGVEALLGLEFSIGAHGAHPF